jgi:hypothetical protein
VDFPLLILATLPGLVIWVAGLGTIIRAPGDDAAIRLRGGRMMALGAGLVVLGPALVVVAEGILGEDPLRIVGATVAFGPAILILFWYRHRVRVGE